MAKDKKKSKKKDKHKGAGEYVATDFSAIHWLALEIEQAAISAYVTTPGNFSAIEKTLRDSVKSLRAKNAALDTEDGGDCPAGWEDCGGTCAPMCGA
jgi:hypothetical protein